MGGPSRWLLIGNSRWHWAEGPLADRRYWSEPPAPELSAVPDRWAAVGPWPPGLNTADRITVAQVPLLGAPTWLGVDRALAGWQAWRRSGLPVLVADAGTALSLTWVDHQGGFGGGRLLAGAALQLQALHNGTQALPSLAAPWSLPDPWCSARPDPSDGWPQQTEAAMVVGVLEGLAGALQRAAAQLGPRQPGLRRWLTGGDGERLLRLLSPSADQPLPWTLDPGLCLDALASLS